MLSVYLHIPFCRSKCGYCDFFSVRDSHPLFEVYPGLLRRQLELSLASGQWCGPVTSVYFGGGTPSLLRPTVIDTLLRTIDAGLNLARDTEVTLEANPGELSLSRLQGYRTAGINRLSLGVQARNSRLLNLLGRRHDARDSARAVDLARRAGFANLSLDLMFALPGQTLKELRGEIDWYLAMAPEHVSCYGLTAEGGTPLGEAVRQGRTVLPDEDAYADAFLCLHETLEAAGYRHYEIANFARSGYASRHNCGYWQRQASLGLGAGAHSFQAAGWGQRQAVSRDLEAYQTDLLSGHDPAETIETYDRAGAMSETLYLGLRTRHGVDDQDFRQTFGAGVAEAFPEAVRQLSSYLRKSCDCWRLQPAAWLIYDRLIQAFL